MKNLEMNVYDAEALNNLRDIVNESNIIHGWRQNSQDMKEMSNYYNVTGKDYSRLVEAYVVGTNLALIHSEISEALEGYRKNKMDDHILHRKNIEVELADAMIRIFDLCGYLNLDIGGAVIEKHAYNAIRADHKPENRAKENGKKF